MGTPCSTVNINLVSSQMAPSSCMEVLEKKGEILVD